MTDPLTRLSAALSDHYRIERELGQGGMATVYLAEDLRHHRKVAIKVLKSELTGIIGAERFLTEIRTTANLQHPHILALFESGEADGLLYYVMPYVEGETVRDRLVREKLLPIADAVQISTEVANALDYAHRHNVIHRDIKPENILLHDGRALVADFGIALAASQAGGARMTETGISLGTPHYMSPEQAMGEREITARSDVYALGAVLYEMLTGDPPFTGRTRQVIAARVVTESPRPLVPQRRTIPPQLEAAVLTALEKLPADRFASATEFARALSDSGYVGKTTRMSTTVPLPSRRWRYAVPGVAILALLAIGWAWLRPRAEHPVAKYWLAFPDGKGPRGEIFCLTPDASHLVYSGRSGGGPSQLWVKARDEDQASPLAGTLGAAQCTISPDGTRVAYMVGNEVREIPLTGGGSVTLANDGSGTPLTWLDEETVVYTSVPPNRLRRVSAEGGPAADLLPAESLSTGDFLPAALPRGRAILFLRCNDIGCSESRLMVADLRRGGVKPLVPGVGKGWYLPGGFLAYVGRDGTLFAQRFDVDRLELKGTPVALMEGLSLFAQVVPNLALSSNGTMVVEVGSSLGKVHDPHELVLVDRAGAITRVDSGWTFLPAFLEGNQGWALSPDGQRLAIGLHTDVGDDIWIKELPRGPLSRFTREAASEERPHWTSDGRSITYLVNGSPVLLQRRADGTGPVDTVLMASPSIYEGRWTRDGRRVVLRTGGNTGRSILVYQPGADSVPHELFAGLHADEWSPAVSPDGRWLAYVSSETGQSEVYLRPFPDVEAGKWQVSTGGGQAPLWAHSGRELFYVDSARTMIALAVPAEGPTRLGARRPLFRLEPDIYLLDQEYYTPFDITPDDRAFVMIRQVTPLSPRTSSFLLVENWFEVVKAKVGGR